MADFPFPPIPPIPPLPPIPPFPLPPFPNIPFPPIPGFPFPPILNGPPFPRPVVVIGLPDFEPATAPPILDAVLIDLLAAANDKVRRGLPDRIYFPYMPEEFSEGKSAEYSQVNIHGRSEPIYGYSHSSSRVFNLNLTFAATDSPFDDVIAPLWLIRSWVYPDYHNEGGTPNVPPRVLFVVGRWLSQRCIVTNIAIRYRGPWGRFPVDTQDRTPGNDAVTLSQTGIPASNLDSVIPYFADVALTLVEVSENTSYTPFGTGQIRTGDDRGSGSF